MGNLLYTSAVPELRNPLGWEAKRLLELYQVQLPQQPVTQLPWPGWLRTFTDISSWQMVKFIHFVNQSFCCIITKICPQHMSTKHSSCSHTGHGHLMSHSGGTCKCSIAVFQVPGHINVDNLTNRYHFTNFWLTSNWKDNRQWKSGVISGHISS